MSWTKTHSVCVCVCVCVCVLGLCKKAKRRWVANKRWWLKDPNNVQLLRFDCSQWRTSPFTFSFHILESDSFGMEVHTTMWISLKKERDHRSRRQKSIEHPKAPCCSNDNSVKRSPRSDRMSYTYTRLYECIIDIFQMRLCWLHERIPRVKAHPIRQQLHCREKSDWIL